MSYSEFANQTVQEPTNRFSSSYVESWGSSVTGRDYTGPDLIECLPSPTALLPTTEAADAVATPTVRSEDRKRKLSSMKPFKCNVPNCVRKSRGFITANDLARHQKSVHHIELQKSRAYQCASEKCRSWDKIWPRLDNFKLHITRMHKDEDEQDLIDRSIYHPLEVIPTVEVLPSCGRDTKMMDMPSNHHEQLTLFTSDEALETLPRISSLHASESAIGESSHMSPDRPVLRSPLELLSKLERQRQVNQIYPKEIVRPTQSSSTGNDQDLASVILRVLANTTLGFTDYRGLGDEERNNLTKDEALKASRAISDLIKKSRKQQFQTPKGALSPNSETCEKCGISFARSCDKRKHMKCHTKLYGCTYPKCYRRFAAKSDWKRHENSQHFQLESFSCQLPSPSSRTPCRELFQRVELFKTHLQLHHNMDNADQVAHEVKTRRIGKNGQASFWCGFCEQIVPLKTKRNAAWDERYNHIGDHFYKEKRSIEDWLCVEMKKTKGEALRDIGRVAATVEDMNMERSHRKNNSPSTARAGSKDAPAQAGVALEPLSATQPLQNGKRRASTEPPGEPNPPKKMKSDRIS